MDFSYFPGKFSINGNVNLTHGNHVWSTSDWSDEFKVEYDVIVEKNMPGWVNLLHVAHDGERRRPAVFLYPTYFHICYEGLGCENYDYELNKEYHFEISQDKNPSGEAIYSIKVNGETFFEIVNTAPVKLEDVKLYLSNPWHSTFAPFGKLSNLKVNADLTQ